MQGNFQANENLIIYIYVPALPCLGFTFIDVVSLECRALLIYVIVYRCQPNLTVKHRPLGKEGHVALLVHLADIHTD